MPIYKVEGPGGRIYRVEGPAGASNDAIISALQEHLKSAAPSTTEAPAPAPVPESGIGAAFRSGLSSLEGDVQAVRAAFGAEGAEAKAAEARKRAAEQYKQPEFLDSPLSYIAGLAAQSAPYMVAPIVAGGIAASAPVSTAIGLGAGAAGLLGAGAVSAAQFTGSNLSRQLELGKAAKDLEVLNAVGAAIPQAALDTISLRMIPGLRGILGKAGMELTEQQAAKIAKDGIIGTVSNYVKAYGPGVLKTAGTEGLTEAGQQVLERAQAGLAITDPEARKEYFDSFVGGALLGGVFAVPGQAVERGQARDKYAEIARVKNEAEAKKAAEAEAARRQTPEFLIDELDATFNKLQEQKAALLEQRNQITGGKAKLPKNATQEQREAFADIASQLKQTEQSLYKLGPVYSQNREAIKKAKEERRLSGMSQQDVFLENLGVTAEEEAPADNGENYRTLLDLQPPAAKVETDSTEGAQKRAETMLAPLNQWKEGPLAAQYSDNEVEKFAIDELAKNPALAARMVAERIPVPGFNSKASKRILDALKLQTKEREETKVSKEIEALQRMGERTRGPQVFEKSAEDLNYLFGELERSIVDTKNTQEQSAQDKRVNDILNELVGELKKKQTESVVPSDVPLGGGAVQRTDIGTKSEDLAALQEMLERYRVLSRQKGASRNDEEMSKLLTEIKAIVQPDSVEAEQNISALGETPEFKNEADRLAFTNRPYVKEINRLVAEQEASFRPAVEAIFNLSEIRKTLTPNTIVGKKTTEKLQAAVAEEKAAKDKFINAVLQEIEANRRAGERPSLTADEVGTLSGQISNILNEAGTRTFGAPAEAQEVLREQINDIRREASAGGERKFQKSPDGKELKLRSPSTEEKGTPTELGERRTAVTSRMEKLLADKKIELDTNTRDVLADATRMVDDGSGNQTLIGMLEEVADRYEGGLNLDLTEKDLFSPEIVVPEGQKLQATARPEQQTTVNKKLSDDLVPKIADELRLVRKSVAEDDGQGDLFSKANEENTLKGLKKRLASLEASTAARKDKKITLEEYKQHRKELAEIKTLPREIAKEEKRLKTAPNIEEGMVTATKRSTPGRFMAYVRSREVAAIKKKLQAETNKVVADDKKDMATATRQLGILDATITQAKAKLDELVKLVKDARARAEKTGKRTKGYDNAVVAALNRATNVHEELAQLQGVYASIRQYSNQQAFHGEASLKIIAGYEKEISTLEKLIKKQTTEANEKLEAEKTAAKKELADAEAKLKKAKDELTATRPSNVTLLASNKTLLSQEAPTTSPIIEEKIKLAKAKVARKKADVAEIEKNIASLDTKKPYVSHITKNKKLVVDLQKTLDTVRGAFLAETTNYSGLLEGLRKKIAAIESIDPSKLFLEADAYPKQYANTKQEVVTALDAAKEFRGLLDSMQKDRAAFVSKIAGAKRAQEALARPAPVQDVTASEKEAQRKTGLGLSGTRVMRTEVSMEINDVKKDIEDAKDLLEELKERRETAKGFAKGALTKKINKLETETLPQLGFDLEYLESSKAGTVKNIETGPAKGDRFLPTGATKKEGKKFKEGFDEFKLSRDRQEGELPYMATKKLSAPELRTGVSQTDKQKKKTTRDFEEALASERGDSNVNRLEAISRGAATAKNQSMIAKRDSKNREDDSFARGSEVESPDLTATQVKHLENNDIVSALRDLSKDKNASEENRVIAGRLALFLDNTDVVVADKLFAPDGGEVLGMAISTKVQLSRDGGLSQEVFLHEATHAAVDRILNMDEKLLTPVQLMAKRELTALFNSIKNDPSITSENAKSKLVEFVAEVFSNSNLQQQLKAKSWKLSDAWKGIKRIILGLLGIKNTDTMFSAAVQAIDVLLVPSSVRLNTTTTTAAATNANPEAPSFARVAVQGQKTPEDIAAAVNKIVAGPKSMMERITSEATGIGARTAFIDRLAPMERVAEYLKKSSQAMQMLYYGRIHDQRMSMTGEVLNNGAPTLVVDEKGNYVVESRGGANLLEISKMFADVKGYGNAEAVRNLFTAWLAAKRAKNLGIGKAKLNFSEDVSQAELDRIEALGDQIPQFEKARKAYNAYNKGLIDWIKQAGAINKNVYDELTSVEDYIPYYRARGDSVIMEIAGIQPFTIGNLQQQPYLKELVGGDAKIQDFFTSSLQNTSMLVDMGLRNLATKEMAFSLQEAGLLMGKEDRNGVTRFMFKGMGPAQPNVIRFKKDGADYYAVVESEAIGVPSELLVKGLHGTPTMLGGVTKFLAIPARFLRAMITRSPLYPVRQLIRDSTTNFMIAGGDMVPVASAAKELVKIYAGKSDGERTLQKRGIIGGQILTGTSEDTQKLMLQLASGGAGWEMAMAKLDRIALSAEAASRATLYNSYRNKQGLSDMEATLATLESMNFSKRGVSGSLYAANMMIPFLNSQIQGLDVLYKALTGKLPYSEKLKVQRKLYTRGLMLAGLTIGYAAMMQDDEAYKNANMRDRLANWFVRIPGVDEPIKVPIPFEVGLIFKALPEAMFLVNQKDRDLSEVLSGIKDVAAGSVPFGPSSVPQGVKPLLELAVNRSFFSGQDIESSADLQLIPSERVGKNTSGVSKLFGETFGVSPKQVDHLINGYTGGLGLAIAQAVGSIIPLTPGPSAPEKRLSDLPVVGSMFQPNDAPGQINLFYEKAKKYEQAKKTFDKMVDEGRGEDAQKFAEKYATDIAMSDVAESFKNTMGDFTEMENLIKASDLSPKEKMERLQEIRGAKIEFARSFNAASRQQ